MEKFIVGLDECFLKKAKYIENLNTTQLYVDMSGVSRLYPYGSAKNIEIGEGNLITITWKNVRRGITLKPTEANNSVFKIILMYDENKYLYTSPDYPSTELLIQCINE